MQWKDSQGYKYIYTGEVDLSDNMCGFGTATEKTNFEQYKGTFLDGKCHGFGMSFCIHDGSYLF